MFFLSVKYNSHGKVLDTTGGNTVQGAKAAATRKWGRFGKWQQQSGCHYNQNDTFCVVVRFAPLGAPGV